MIMPTLRHNNRKLGRCDIGPRTANVKFQNSGGKNREGAITELQGTNVGIDCSINEYIQHFGGNT